MLALPTLALPTLALPAPYRPMAGPSSYCSTDSHASASWQ